MSTEQNLPMNNLTPFNDLAQVADEKRTEEMHYRMEARKIRSEQQIEGEEEEEESEPRTPSAQTSSSFNNDASSPLPSPRFHSSALPSQQWNNSQISGSRRINNESISTATINLQRSNLQDLRTQVTKLEAQNRELILANNQADSEMQVLRYELDLAKDQLDDYQELRKAEHDKFLQLKQESSYLRMHVKALESKVHYLQLQLSLRDDIIVERGWIPVDLNVSQNDSIELKTSCDQENGDTHHPFHSMIMSTATCQRLLKLRSTFSDSSKSSKHKDPRNEELENFINILADNYESLIENSELMAGQVLELQERVDVSIRMSTFANDVNGSNDSPTAVVSPKTAVANAETLKNTKALVHDYKIKLSQTEQQVTSLQSDVIRLEGQVKRYRSVAETAEKHEEEAKASQRRLQREMRNLENIIEDLKSDNKVLQRKLEKFSGGKTLTLPTNKRPPSPV